MQVPFADRIRWLGPLAGVAALSIGLGLGAVALGAASTGPSPLSTAAGARLNGSGDGNVAAVRGKIKHVWLIILENKSYDATFTGLNNNTYLWKTLPK